MNWKDSLLCSILNCGVYDLDFVKSCIESGDGIFETIAQMNKDNQNISFNGLFNNMVINAIRDLEYALANKKFEYEMNKDVLTELNGLDPTQDINYYINYGKIYVFLKNYDLYVTYLCDEIEWIEDKYGLEFFEGSAY